MKGETMKQHTYYVCIVPLAYEIMSLAASEEEAINLAASKAAEYLTKQGLVYESTGKPHTADTIVEFFGTRTYEIKTGTAIVCS
jgi:hypothetical protein